MRFQKLQRNLRQDLLKVLNYTKTSKRGSAIIKKANISVNLKT